MFSASDNVNSGARERGRRVIIAAADYANRLYMYTGGRQQQADPVRSIYRPIPRLRV